MILWVSSYRKEQPAADFKLREGKNISPEGMAAASVLWCEYAGGQSGEERALPGKAGHQLSGCIPCRVEGGPKVAAPAVLAMPVFCCAWGLR